MTNLNFLKILILYLTAITISCAPMEDIVYLNKQYNVENKNRQDKIDRILDKISKSGYESLSKKEKDYLFKQSEK